MKLNSSRFFCIGVLAYALFFVAEAIALIFFRSSDLFPVIFYIMLPIFLIILGYFLENPNLIELLLSSFVLTFGYILIKIISSEFIGSPSYSSEEGFYLSKSLFLANIQFEIIPYFTQWIVWGLAVFFGLLMGVLIAKAFRKKSEL